MTVSVAELLVAVPNELVTIARYCPASAVVVLAMAYVADVAPLTLVQLPLTNFCHWYASGAVPLAITVKLADCPTLTF